MVESSYLTCRGPGFQHPLTPTPDLQTPGSHMVQRHTYRQNTATHRTKLVNTSSKVVNMENDSVLVNVQEQTVSSSIKDETIISLVIFIPI